METRPAPPVYRPQETQASLQPRTNLGFMMAEVRPAPAANDRQSGAHAIQAKAFPACIRFDSRVVQRSRNLKNLKCYRPGMYQEVVKAFTRNGYTSVDPAIERGFTDWGDAIPGHCSSKPGKDSGEQGDTGPKCEEARDYLIDWAGRNPAPSGEGSSTYTGSTEDTGTREKKKKQRQIEKQRIYLEKNTTPGYTPSWEGGPSSYYRPSWKNDLRPFMK